MAHQASLLYQMDSVHVHSLYEMPSYVNGNIQFSPPFALHAPSSDDVSYIVGGIEFEFIILISHSFLPVT